MAEKKEFTYYKKAVAYYVGVRMNLRDPIGRVLTTENPDVAVDLEELRDFKMANKKAIMEGLIVPTAEPDLEWETPNAVSDEEIEDLILYYAKLKARLPTINSLSVVVKILNRAKEKNKSPKLLGLIEARRDELEEITEVPQSDRGVE